MLCSYASNPHNSKGRLYTAPPFLYGNEFAHDCKRIIYSNSFRRLQYKTQVFINHEGDHYRNRLTHSLEVSYTARFIAKELNLSEELAECIAIAHDLGHPPFGHAGEEALHECMKEHGGFSHNAQSLKILTKLEYLSSSHEGLNLTWEVLEGIVKHNGPLVMEGIPWYILEYNLLNDLQLNTYPSAEAQIASLADDLTYVCHDIEDGVKSKLISLEQLSNLPLIDKYIFEINAAFKEIETSYLLYQISNRLSNELINDLLLQTKTNIDRQKINNADDIRHLSYPLVDFSEIAKTNIKKIKAFLFEKVYRHSYINAVTLKGQKIIKELFKLYMSSPELLPAGWRESGILDIQHAKAIMIADYIAGMTDRFAIKEYQSFYNISFNNI